MSPVDMAEQMSDLEGHDRLFALAGDLMCVSNADGYFVRVNPAFTATLGWTDEELLSRPILDFVHHDDRAATDAEGRKHREGTPTRQFENRYRHKDGSWRWFSWNATPVAAEGLTYAVARDVTAQKRSAEALRQSEERFRLLISEAPTGMALAAADGHVLEVNRALCQMLGYTVRELLEQGAPILTHPDDLPESRALIERLLAGESQSATLEKRYLHQDGHVVWTHYTAILLRDEAGQPLYFIYHLQDITARKQAEEMQAQLAAIVEASDDAIFGKTLDGVVTAWNGGAERLYGYRADEMIGQSVAQLIPPERSGELAAIMQTVARGETIRQYETERVRQDGVRVAVALTIAPIRDAAGRVTSASVVARDITARTEAEAALRASEERYRLLAENATDLISRHTPEGAYLYASPACVTLLGYTSDELMRQLAYERFHPDDILTIRASHAQALLGEKPAIVAYRLRHKQGHYLWVETTSRAVRDPHTGAVREIQCATRDISERKRAEVELAEARETALAALREKAVLTEARQAELERSNRDLQQFASVVAHDLRTPLASIHGYADLLRLLHIDQDNAEAMECIDYILTASARMNGLMSDVLAYARAGGTQVPRQPVDCAATVRGAIDHLRAAIEACGASITCGELPVVHGYPAQLGQLFQNLIGNALKFRKPDQAPHVEVTAQREGARWRISVADDGIGLNPPDAERIFGVFERAHAREGYEGTGLGLAICARIVERHGGRIWVESSPGAGATFRVNLPVLDDADAPDWA